MWETKGTVAYDLDALAGDGDKHWTLTQGGVDELERLEALGRG